MIRVEGLQFAYGSRPILRGIDLDVVPGEILTVLGPNGCGKSTLLKLLRGVLKPAAGSVRWQQSELHRLARREVARRIAVVAQTAEIGFAYTVRELVAMGRYAGQPLFGALTPADRSLIDAVLQTTDVRHLADRPVTALSGGELQRVMLARALAQQAPMLLLDEATSHLDLIHRLSITELLLRLNREQATTIVQVSHDFELAAEMSDRLLLLDGDGRVAALGPPPDVLTPAHLHAVYGVEAAIDRNPYSGSLRVYSLRPARRPGLSSAAGEISGK